MKDLGRKVTVAHDGAFKTKCPEDEARTVESVVRIMRFDNDFFNTPEVKHETINLIHGRDFLEEDYKYDVVVLHSIFNPPDPKAARGKAKRWLWLSDRHSVPNWKRRLARSKAIYISVCEGQPYTLSGWHLGDIRGYKIVDRDGKMTIYKKEET